jgi:NADH-quinone oxidoreductase subunit C
MKSTSNNAAKREIPEVQQRLEKALRDHFGEVLIALPAHAWAEYGLTIGVRPEDLLKMMSELKALDQFQFSMFVNVTCVDWMDRREPRFDVVYQLLSLEHRHRLCVKVAVCEEKPEVESVVSLWPGAAFMEREVWDMYGVTFLNNGDLRRILLYDEFEGHPLRKDYPLKGKQPRIALRVPELRNTSADMSRGELVSLPSRRETAGESS